MATRENAGDLELGLLRTFLRVVSHGSLRKAAVACNLTQPAISHQLRRLETIAGKRLFVRGRDGVSLTPKGELLLTHAHIALELSQETLRKMRGEDPCEHVALGVSTELALAGLSSALKRFQFIHPDLQLHVAVATASKPVAKKTATRPDHLRSAERNGTSALGPKAYLRTT